MRVRMVSAMAVASLLLALAAVPAVAAGERLTTVASGLSTPLLVTAPDGDARLFIVERAGRILVQQPNGSREVFLDIRSRISTSGEGGLLGLAFSPDYATDGRFWVDYYGTDARSHLDRYTVSADPDRAATGSRTAVLAVDQPADNHNGGMIAFARDDMLLVALGDGGGGGDPFANGQDTSTLLGSILRLDVKDRPGGGYDVPADNPFVGRAGRDEIWLYGVRNPYRFSVDRSTGVVWIGDVGQSRREEINRIPYQPGTARNLGWNRWEGTSCYQSCGGTGGITFPVAEFDHQQTSFCSITGGYVSRSARTPDLTGDYLFADYCQADVRAYDPDTGRSRSLGLPDLGNVFSFGEDGAGDLYVMNGSTVYRVDGPPSNAFEWFLGSNDPPHSSSRLFFGTDDRPGTRLLLGDWDGDGTDTPGISFARRGARVFALDDDLSGGSPSRGEVNFGRDSDEPLTGDVDGDGDDDRVVRRGRQWYLDYDGRRGTDRQVGYGRPSDTPLLGDVDGDGIDDLVVRRGRTWFVDLDRRGGTDLEVGYGRPSDTPLLGDVDGDGDDDLGVRRGTRFYFATGRIGGATTVEFDYGRRGDVPLVGDVTGGDADEPVVVR